MCVGVALLAEGALALLVGVGTIAVSGLVAATFVRHGVSLALAPREVEVQQVRTEVIRDVRSGAELWRHVDGGRAVHVMDRVGGVLFALGGLAIVWLPALAIGLALGRMDLAAIPVAGLGIAGWVVRVVTRRLAAASSASKTP